MTSILDTAMQAHRSGNLDEAERLYRLLLAQTPAHPDALHLLGVTCRQKGRPQDAVDLIRRALAIRNVALYWNNLGNALMDLRKHHEAVQAFRNSLALEPENPLALHNLGGALRDTGEPLAAIELLRRALPHFANVGAAHSSLASAYRAANMLEPAIEKYRHACALDPGNADLHYNLGMALLTAGQFSEGWKEYEWRWQSPDFAEERALYHQLPWRGEPLAGRSILIHAEQGLGDAIQFVRFAPLVAERGGRVVIRCQPALVRLLGSLGGVAEIIPDTCPVPHTDVHLSMLSLPGVFGTDLSSIPPAPYLKADAAAKTLWRERLASHGRAPRVGIVWAGSKSHDNDTNRSIPPALFSPLADVPGVTYVCLQVGERAIESRPPLPMTDMTHDLHDFADTAGLVSALDLVLTVDTAVAHLAGALGIPTWLMLPFAPDWRWMMARPDSPWYPSMTLFRQPAPMDWKSVVAEVLTKLKSLVPQ